MSKISKCPKCGSRTESEWYGLGRKLRDVCTDFECNWVGELRTPDVRPIETTATYFPHGPGGWHFTGFDGYGHVFHCSQSFRTYEECLAAARAEIQARSEDPFCGYGKCSAVIWPPSVIVAGELVTP